MSREVKKFWSHIESIVRIKFNKQMAEKKKEAMDRHLEVSVNVNV